MPDIVFNGPEGRLEGRYHHSKKPGSPIALVLHFDPQHGGTMNNKIVYAIYQVFVKQGFPRFASTFGASGGRRASSMAEWENCRMRRAGWIGFKPTIRTRRLVGSPDIPSVPGSACN